jgi:hypothetical protein
MPGLQQAFIKRAPSKNANVRCRTFTKNYLTERLMSIEK